MMLLQMIGGAGFAPALGVVRNSQMTGPANTNIPRIDLVNDGSATAKNNAGSNVAAADWGTPNTPAIGSSYWIRFTNVSGAGVYNGVGAGATWNSLSAGVFIGINAAGAGGSVARSGTYDIASDSGGATIVASGTYTFSSDRT